MGILHATYNSHRNERAKVGKDRLFPIPIDLGGGISRARISRLSTPTFTLVKLRIQYQSSQLFITVHNTCVLEHGAFDYLRIHSIMSTCPDDRDLWVVRAIIIMEFNWCERDSSLDAIMLCISHFHTLYPCDDSSWGYSSFSHPWGILLTLELVFLSCRVWNEE